MAITNGYVTLPEAAEAMRIPAAATSHEALIELAVEAASRDVDAHCERRFYGDDTATARTFQAYERDWLDVDDIATTDGLIVKTDDDYDGTFETTWASTDYQTEPLNGVVAGQSGWPIEGLLAVGDYWFPMYRKRALVQITAKWGWAAVPKAVKQATLAQIASVYKSPEALHGVASMNEFGPISVRPLHPTAAHLLRRYVKDPVTAT